MSATQQGPLAGLTVIDVGTIFAGPSVCRRLADFGADVVKVERPGAPDGARHLGEPDGSDSFHWRLVGRNKRPISLDLKTESGRGVLLRLVQRADVLVESFRPGVLERLGLDPHDVLLRENPGLVVLRVTGFGQTGPYARRAGFGTVAEAMATLAHTTGQPDGPPTLPPIALADEVTGLQGAFAVLAALRYRDASGLGQVIDLSLLESLIDIIGPAPAVYHRTGKTESRLGSRLAWSAPRNVYACADGHFVLSGSSNEAALRIFDAIGRSELRNDPRFGTPTARVRSVDELDRIIDDWACSRTVGECVATLSDAGVACGPVYSIAELVHDQHVVERGCFVEVENPAGEGPLLQLAPAPRMSLTPGVVRHAGLAEAARTDEVLLELGYHESDIAELRKEGAIGPPSPAPGLERVTGGV